jgi:hypothetical protein
MDCTNFDLKKSLKKCHDNRLDDHRIIVLLCQIDLAAHRQENQKEIYWLYDRWLQLDVSQYVWDTFDTAVECLNYSKTEE